MRRRFSSIIRFILRLWRILWGILIGWFINFVRLLWRAFRLLLQDLKPNDPCGPRKPSVPCRKIPGDIYQRADPFIYSQRYLRSLGMAVTWDNPDIDVLDGNAIVPSHHLAPSTDYTVRIQIWNGSFRAPAVGLQVKLEYRNFGINTPAQFIGETIVNLPVRGAPGHPIHAFIPWHTPRNAGHYCILATLIWADDANPNNNIGQENTDVIEATRGKTASAIFPLTNNTRQTQKFHLGMDRYQLPEKPSFPEERHEYHHPKETLMKEMDYHEGRDLGNVAEITTKNEQHRMEVVKKNSSDAFSIPDEWQAKLSQTEIELLPGKESNIEFSITVPQSVHKGEKYAFNVFALNKQGILEGGATVYVVVK